MSDLPIKHEIQKRILPHGNLSERWISLKKYKLGFHGFVIFAFQFGKSEKKMQSCSREQRYMMRQQWVCEIHLAEIFPWGKICFMILCFCRKSEIQISKLNSDFPIENTQYSFCQDGAKTVQGIRFIRLISILEVRINVCHQWKIKKIQKEWNQIINIWQKCSNGNQNAISKLFAQIKV